MLTHPSDLLRESAAHRDALIVEAAVARLTRRPRPRIVWPAPSYWFRSAAPAAAPACCPQPA